MEYKKTECKKDNVRKPNESPAKIPVKSPLKAAREDPRI